MTILRFLHGMRRWLACVAVFAAYQKCAGQDDGLGNQRCNVGTDYSSNYDEFRAEWYYYYQFWPIGSVPDESQQASTARENPLRRSEGVVATDCGPGFDACKTVITTVKEDILLPDSDAAIPWQYAKVTHSCAYMDYCYRSDVTTSSNLPTQQGTQKNYDVRVQTLCCNDDFLCNDQVADDYSQAQVPRLSPPAAFLITSIVTVVSVRWR